MKKWLAAGLLLIGILILILTPWKPDTQPLKALYSKELDWVSELAIQDGRTGESRWTADPAFIADFLRKADDTAFIPGKDQEEIKGSLYRATLSDGNQTFHFTSGTAGKTNYHTDPDITLILDEFFKKLPLDEAAQPHTETATIPFLINSEFHSLGLYKVNGTGTTTYAAEKDLKMLHDLFSQASEQKGIVNMADAKLMMEIEHKNHSKQKIQLWLGEKGQESVIEKIDIMDDTHTLYTIPEKLAVIFRTMVDRIEELDSK